MPRHIERQQHLERSQIELRDQHDRVWLAESEVGLDIHRKPKIVVVGQIHPQFTAPYDFLPDAKYLEYDPAKPGRIHINYQAWETAVKQAHKEVKAQLTRLAMTLYKSEAAKYVENPTTEMIEVVYGNGLGPEPWEPVAAARQGNGWILGLREYDPTIPGDVKLKEHLERWVKVRYRDVVLNEDGEVSDEIDFTEGQKKPRKLATA